MINNAPKKKRWEDKVFDFILGFRTEIMKKEAAERDKIYVGQKIIHKNPVKDKIFIFPDGPSLKRSALLFLCIALLLFCFFVWGGKFSWLFLVISICLCIPFLVSSVAYYIQSRRSHKPWIIDLENKKIVMGKTLIDFEQVNYFNFSKLVNAEDLIPISERDYSYQLNLILINGDEITLLTDHNKSEIGSAGSFFEGMTGITLKKDFVNA